MRFPPWAALGTFRSSGATDSLVFPASPLEVGPPAGCSSPSCSGLDEVSSAAGEPVSIRR